MIYRINEIQYDKRRIVLKTVKICGKMYLGIMQVNEYVNLH